MPSPASVDDGNVYSIPGLSVDTLDDDFLPAMDVSQYDWMTVYIGSSTYSGQLSAQGTFDATDNSSWKTLQNFWADELAIGNSVIDSTTYVAQTGPIRYPWLRIRATSWSSGTAVGGVELKKGARAITLSGAYATLLGSGFNIGFINNDGNKNLSIASGHNSDTIVSANPGMLGSILVTAQNTNQMTFYDNASAASGDILGIVPANQAVDGKPFTLHAPAVNGIYVSGNANNPGVRISYS
jgi:hypothetical protein